MSPTIRLGLRVLILVALAGAPATSAGAEAALERYKDEGLFVTVPANVGGGLGLVIGLPLGVLSGGLCVPAYYPLHAAVPLWTRHNLGDDVGDCKWVGYIVCVWIMDAGYTSFGAPFYGLAHLGDRAAASPAASGASGEPARDRHNEAGGVR